MQQPLPRTTTSTPTTRQISCKRCQKRKIKCSRTDPCINCAALQVPCEYRDDGARRFPVSRDYVASLEARVARLEAFIAEKLGGEPGIQHVNDRDRDAHHWMKASENGEAMPTSAGSSATPGLGPLAASLLPEEGGERDSTTPAQLVYHGPTSIYSGAFTTFESSSDQDENGQKENDLVSPLTPCLDAGERRMSECIALFFHWQYPQFMFIDREAFILDFRSGALGGRFCSSALVNAICSIGALVSSDPDTRRAAGDFALVAKGLLLGTEEEGSKRREGKLLPTPHVTSVQALLCCGFYEIGLGNFSDGWLYSGMAFRMGQDLGFQRDPDTWTKRGSKSTPEASWDIELEKEFRRRIYWGCYISDKFFSLFLGRPCFLHELDADVKPSRPKPQEPIFNNWLIERQLGHLQDRTPLIPKLTLVFNKQIEIGTVIREGLSMVYSPRAQQQQEHSSGPSEISLSGINAKLSRFRDRLPPEMRIKEWSSLAEPVQPHLAVMHLSSVPSRTKEASEDADTLNLNPSSSSASPAAICTQSAERLLQILKRFRKQHGLRHAPLVLVHGTISAISALLAVHVGEVTELQNRHAGDGNIAAKNSSNKSSHALTLVHEFSTLLPDFEDTWVIARKAGRRTEEIMARLGASSSDSHRRAVGQYKTSHIPVPAGAVHGKDVTATVAAFDSNQYLNAHSSRPAVTGVDGPANVVDLSEQSSLGLASEQDRMEGIWFTESDNNSSNKAMQQVESSYNITQTSQDLAWLEDILLLPEYSMDIIDSPGNDSAAGASTAGGGFL